MEKFNRIPEAFLIAVAIVVMGVCLKAGIDNFTNKDRRVTAKGLAEREVAADKVTWPIVSVELGNDLPQLYNKINSTTSKIRTFLKENGVPDEDISVNPPVVQDKNANLYSNERVVNRYNITSVITVTSNDVAKIRGIISRQGELLRQGVAIIDGGYENPIVYEYTGFNEIKPEMMKEAIANAQATAEQFAGNCNSELDKIITATQGQFSISDRDNNSPLVKFKIGGIMSFLSKKSSSGGLADCLILQ